jgi:mono/diheme cytochrome c family protein
MMANEFDENDTSKSRRRFATAFLMAFAMLLSVGAGTVAAQGEVDDPALVEAGMAIFETNCAGCHSADGTGSNAGRPLTGIAAQQSDRSVHIASVTDGKGGMPAFGERLSADEINAAVTYVRITFVAQDEAELAVTGANDRTLATIGLLTIAAGFALVALSRRARLI